MREVRVRLDRSRVVGTTDRRLFGAFVEHLGRCIYGGLFEPEHPTATPEGFRRDVLELVRELSPSILRYPGGNFVSGYNWEDGVGPVKDRPTRMELAWLSLEPNMFGTNEFIDWCRLANIEPMLAVNLGTRGPDEARRLVEYCNHPSGTRLSELRRAHGWDQPHAVKFWCLGNEVDGPWQMGSKTATEYGRIATEAAKLMRLTDPTVELAAVGSSGRNMPTFGAWEREVLDHTFDHVEFISLHTYLNDYADDPAALLASPDLMDDFIDEVVAIADEVAAKKKSPKQIMLSFDEWNVWYRTRRRHLPGRTIEGWPIAPSILEEIYSMKDALAFGGACISLLNHADRVRTACLAQLVNAIAPIMTETGGPAWRQTIFFPFFDFSNFGRGTVLSSEVDCPTYSATYRDPRGTTDLEFPMPAVPFLKIAAVHSEKDRSLTLFLLNRSLDEEMPIEVAADGFANFAPGRATTLAHSSLDAVNTSAAPDTVGPTALVGVSSDGNRIRALLKPASWSMIRLTVS
jgi:alpha-N-arabinofuranosidase